jgi:DeoR family transcriptional regulator of aga operon
MIPGERHAHIETILQDRHSVTVNELSEMLDVSSVTIRNDLNHLAELGRLQRTHGGAVVAHNAYGPEFSFETRQQLHSDQKQRIGQRAARLIQPTDVILLDSSTTSFAIAQEIKRNANIVDITVVTTGVRTALALAGASLISTIIIGGIVREISGSATGSLVRNTLNQINIHKAFLGAWGVTIDQGLTETHLLEVELKQYIIAHCDETIAVVDSSKLGRVALASFAGLDEISSLVTDADADAEQIETLRRHGVVVLIA